MAVYVTTLKVLASWKSARIGKMGREMLFHSFIFVTESEG